MIVPGILLALGQTVPGAGVGPAPYWQQRLEYTITARLDEPSGVLGGTERVVYHNNSPDTLRTVSFHLYLNAFRPGSRWADADSAEHRRRFNDLRDPDYGFNRIRGVEIMGERVTAVYPFAPDSTVARFTLPRPAAPGDTFGVAMQWEARPSTVPRRRCPPAGPGGAALWIFPSGIRGGGVRPVRLGGAPALSGGGVLRRLRELCRGARRAGGRGGGRDRRAALRRSGLGARQPDAERAR